MTDPRFELAEKIVESLIENHSSIKTAVVIDEVKKSDLINTVFYKMEEYLDNEGGWY